MHECFQLWYLKSLALLLLIHDHLIPNVSGRYITPRVVAMSMPAEGTTALYRNKFEHVSGFLEEWHGDRYKV